MSKRETTRTPRPCNDCKGYGTVMEMRTTTENGKRVDRNERVTCRRCGGRGEQ